MCTRSVEYREGKNEVWKPSFTLYSYGGAIIDYVPGSGQAQQAERLSKSQVYRYNRIPATVLGPPDLDKPNWDKDLYGRLEQLHRQASEWARYTLTDPQT